MKTVLFALALAMPIGAQTLDYATLCGATEGTGDNNAVLQGVIRLMPSIAAALSARRR